MADNSDGVKNRNPRSFGPIKVADSGAERKAPPKQESVHRTGKPPGTKTGK